MLFDPLQAKLKDMEKGNPSDNNYRVGPVQKVRDFFRLKFRRVEEVPQEEGFQPYVGFGYQPEGIWYDRLRALEGLARTGALPEGYELSTMDDVLSIIYGDDDWRIVDLAKSMVGNFLEDFTFTKTEPYERRLMEERRERIGVKPSTGYKSQDVWYNRLEALETMAKNFEGNVTKSVMKELKAIAGADDDWRVRRLASSMIDSVHSEGNFNNTGPYHNKLREERRLNTNVKSGLGYQPEGIWYDRLDALKKALTYTREDITKDMISDLKRIAGRDDDWRVRELAADMIDNVHSYGSFSSVQVTSEKIAA